MRLGTLGERIGSVLATVLFGATLAAAPFDQPRAPRASRGAQPVPAPFPKPNQPQKPAEPPATPTQPPASATPAGTVEQRPGAPTEAMLGLPIYPGSEFLGSFDAGLGQRYYLFGTNAGFADLVGYYKTVLREKGTLVFDEPATYMFEVGKFREETMAFPPGVTVKDYTWNGSDGYLQVKGAKGTRYRTVIQIVPVPAGSVR
jgi:hypothetical protein